MSVCERFLTLSFASLSLEYILLREAEVYFLALFVERIFFFNF